MNRFKSIPPVISGACLLGLFLCLLTGGCAFDVSHVNRVPATFTAADDRTHDFILQRSLTVELGTGFPTTLKPGTRWHRVGTTEAGAIYSTRDQIVTVEASNIYEAQLVLANHCITGFYLPADKQFVPVSSPLPIDLQTAGSPP